MTYETYSIGNICSMVKGTYPTLNTEAGEYPLVVTAEYRRSASTYQLEGPAVCVPLISSTGHGDATLHRVHYQEGRFALANLLVALQPRDPNLCNAKYLYYLLTAKKNEYFVPLMSGTANVSLKIQAIATVEISLPSIEEQKRILIWIEGLAAKIEEARGLQRSSEKIRLLLFKSASRQIFSAVESYKKTTVEDVCTTIVDNLHSNPIYADSGVSCVRSPDVGWGKLYLDTALKTSEEEYTHRTVRGEPTTDDLILVREGGGTGKVALVEEGQRFSLGQRVMMLRPNKDLIIPKFFLYQMLSPAVYDTQIVPLCKGSASPHLNISSLRRFIFLLPTLSEQRRIVAYLDNLQSKVDTLKRIQAKTSAELDALLPSILDKAFKGEL